MASNAGLTYSGALARAHDYDRFLACLFAPADRRPALWALYAFNYEIARTREVVSDTTLGLIRLQWWHDAFARIYGGGEPPAHEILKDLAPAIHAFNLPKADFERLLYAREFDLEDRPPENLKGLENYADFTASPLSGLAALIAGDKPGEDVSLTAQAYALTGILRAVPFHAGQGRNLMPADLMHENGLSGLPEPGSAFRIVVKTVADRAKTMLDAADPEGKQAKIAARQAAMRLRQIEKADYDAFDFRLARLPPFYALRLCF